MMNVINQFVFIPFVRRMHVLSEPRVVRVESRRYVYNEPLKIGSTVNIFGGPQKKKSATQYLLPAHDRSARHRCRVT